MKSIIAIFILGFICTASYGQTTEGAEFSQERCKKITEYYCKQYIVDEVLEVPGLLQGVEVYICPITAAKSGELTTVLYQCKPLHKQGVVFAFWNDYYLKSEQPYKGLGFYNLDIDKAKELFDNLESLMIQDHRILSEEFGNVVYKSGELTFLFYNSDLLAGDKPVRVWYGLFDSDWNQTTLLTTIMQFRHFFKLD
jgi:hypothetical protein